MTQTELYAVATLILGSSFFGVWLLQTQELLTLARRVANLEAKVFPLGSPTEK